MSVDWVELQKSLSPIKDYDDLCQRLQKSFSYPFVLETFNYSMPELVGYTQRVLGGDARHRYDEYASVLIDLLTRLDRAGVRNLQDLIKRAETAEKLESFSEQSGVSAQGIVTVLKYLIYWFIPTEKYLSGLIQDDPIAKGAIEVFSGSGIRTNLDLLQQGITPAGRRSLAETSKLPPAVINDLVNRADFSRLPWASKATISNIMGAGYHCLDQLAQADPEQLYADFFRYGEAIGKNLKLGNEIENSYRIAKIVPKLVHHD
jgi:hypothetical protein